MKGFKEQSPPPLREIAAKSVFTLRVQQNKLEQASHRLKERDKVLFQSCTTYLSRNNRDRAVICANELAEVRKLNNFLINVHLAIERVVLRLETMKELSDIVNDLKPALQMLQGVSQELFNVLPDVSAEMERMNTTLADTLYATRISSNADELVPVERKTAGGEEILKEVSSYVERKIAETLPEPPMSAPKVEVKQKTAPQRELVALGASSSQAVSRKASDESSFDPAQTILSFKKSEIKEISLTVERPSNEDAVLEYVRKSKGEIDLTRCSSDLQLSSADVERALESLGNKGRIKIEPKMPD
jgi:division protein CdvB (Snf7/Vps24/ESCRT-III family)